MSEVEQDEDRIESVSQEEQAGLGAWFSQFDAQAWDRKIGTVSKAGRLTT